MGTPTAAAEDPGEEGVPHGLNGLTQCCGRPASAARGAEVSSRGPLERDLGAEGEALPLPASDSVRPGRPDRGGSRDEGRGGPGTDLPHWEAM